MMRFWKVEKGQDESRPRDTLVSANPPKFNRTREPNLSKRNARVDELSIFDIRVAQTGELSGKEELHRLVKNFLSRFMEPRRSCINEFPRIRSLHRRDTTLPGSANFSSISERSSRKIVGELNFHPANLYDTSNCVANHRWPEVWKLLNLATRDLAFKFSSNLDSGWYQKLPFSTFTFFIYKRF